MNPLNELEQAIILAAAEKIELGLNVYSCSAIAAANDTYIDSYLRDRYTEFYDTGDERLGDYWLDQRLDEQGDFETDRKELRVLFLLNFLEANK